MTGVIAPSEEARFGDFTAEGRDYSRMTHRLDGDAVVPLSETERSEQAWAYTMATPSYEEQTVTDPTPYDKLMASFETDEARTILNEGRQELGANLEDTYRLPPGAADSWVREHPVYALSPHSAVPEMELPAHWSGMEEPPLTPEEGAAIRNAWRARRADVDYVPFNEGWDQGPIGPARGEMFHVDPTTGLLPSSSQEDELAAAMLKHPAGKIPPLKPVTRLASVPRH